MRPLLDQCGRNLKSMQTALEWINLIMKTWLPECPTELRSVRRWERWMEGSFFMNSRPRQSNANKSSSAIKNSPFFFSMPRRQTGNLESYSEGQLDLVDWIPMSYKDALKLHHQKSCLPKKSQRDSSTEVRWIFDFFFTTRCDFHKLSYLTTGSILIHFIWIHLLHDAMPS